MKRPNEQELLAYYAVGKPILMLEDKESKIYYFTNKHTSFNTEILHISTRAHICNYINLDGPMCTKCLWLRTNYFDGQCLIPESDEELTLLMLGMVYEESQPI